MLKRKFSDEHRQKIREAMLKNPIRYWKGKKLSKEHRKKLSLAQTGKKGKLSNGWKGGKIKKNCLYCNKVFYVIQARKNTAKFCSVYCSAKYRPSREKHYNWKGGICDNNKYLSWIKNKRNRLKYAIIKELGSHSFIEWEFIKKQYNYTCPCCGLSEPFNQRIKYLTEDHIIPLSKGGNDLIKNIQPLCLKCNIKKHTKIIKYKIYENV